MQQRHAPRPLPLFLELLRTVAEAQPDLAARALAGVARYEEAPRPVLRPPRPEHFKSASTIVRDCGGEGAPIVLVPSLINPPSILDLDCDTSLADALVRMGRRVLLVDWGAACARHDLDVSDCVERLARICSGLGQAPAVIGYCLGGTMAIAAAGLARVERVITLASPWNFSGYPPQSRASLQHLWETAGLSAKQLGMLPMEVLQSAFWSLDPHRTVAKYANFAELPEQAPDAQRFIALEDWANEGEPLPYPAARELLEVMFAADLPGRGMWTVAGRTVTDRIDCPLLNVTASEDRITPAEAAPWGEAVQIDSGHVGMVVGSARTKLHRLLNDFLAASPPRR